MSTLWTSEKIADYHAFMAAFTANYKEKIDCADLALVGLIEFAFENRLPVRLKYYKKGSWQWYTSPTYESLDDATNPKLKAAAAKGGMAHAEELVAVEARNLAKKEQFKKLIKVNLGAENVIDNTRKIEPAEALSGDFLMTKRPNGQMGHTRVIYLMVPAFNPLNQQLDYLVSWYQGTYPPEVPEMRIDFLSNLVNGVEQGTNVPIVHEGKPRAWRFTNFE